MSSPQEEEVEPSPVECVRVGNAILCDGDSVLQTWYNQSHAFQGKQLHVVVGSYGAKGRWRRGNPNIRNCMDICTHAIFHDKETPNKVIRLNLYTWLEDDKGNVYDVSRPEWTGEDKPALVDGVSKDELKKLGRVYKQFGGELEQDYALKELEKIYRQNEFNDKNQPLFHDV